ncbi:alpha/beta-hydrolase [Marasmius fiardii PR-910]|nr:alpha/beta-hydrolase [Marasmius fiardii PR-910]
MASRRLTKGFSLIAIGLLLCACGAVFHPTFQRDPTELRVELNELQRNGNWSEKLWYEIKPSKDLRWVDCYAGGLQCGRLLVPLDYNNPHGKTAAIALIRLPANMTPDSPDYLGPILFNPGGPGGSGVDFVRTMGKAFSTVLGPQFDIVGFDPRGVSRSTPRVSFYETRVERKLWNVPVVGEVSEKSPITVAISWARNKLTGRLAAERDHNVIAHINTDHTARDMLRITEAHGREKLKYWGFSYGSVLGSTFAAMFPGKVDRLVIDGVVDVSSYYTVDWANSLRDTDKVLQWFFKDCLEAGPGRCAFYEPSVEAMDKKLNNLYSSITKTPVSVLTDNSYGLVDYARLRLTIFGSFYAPFELWPLLATGLQVLVRDGNGTVLFNILDSPRFQCSCDPLENLFDVIWDAQTAIMCNDGDVVSSDLESAQEDYNKLLKVSEWGSVAAGIRMSCVGWPNIPKTQFRGPIVGNTSHPLLIIGNAADPVTPLWAAHQVSKGFPGSVVLSQESAGHCSFSAPSPCTALAVREYFVNGTLPKAGTKCPIIGSPFDSASQVSWRMEEEDVRLFEALRDLLRFGGRSRMTLLHV